MGATSFDGDISKWDVSSVTDMDSMFYEASAFNGDLATWDVSRVKNMNFMFKDVFSFDCDLSNWDVSSVKHMEGMFFQAASFSHNLCGVSWVRSKASKDLMFEVDDIVIMNVCNIYTAFLSLIPSKICFVFQGTSGSISPTVCTQFPHGLHQNPPVFSAKSRNQLKGAVDAFLRRYSNERDGQPLGADAEGKDRGTFVCGTPVSMCVCVDAWHMLIG